MKLRFLFLITIMLLFTACREGDAKDSVSEKPYKATTVDECIQKRECVWYAFSNYVYKSNLAEPIFRWNKPIQIKFVNNYTSKNYVQLFYQTTKNLSKYFPHEIKMGQDFNSLIVFYDGKKETY